jgi:hypothetical protein
MTGFYPVMCCDTTDLIEQLAYLTDSLGFVFQVMAK